MDKKTKCISNVLTVLIFVSLIFLGVTLQDYEIELQDTFNKTISDKHIEYSPIPFVTKPVYVFEFTEHPFKTRHVNESVYNNYEIGDNYTLVVVYEEW